MQMQIARIENWAVVGQVGEGAFAPRKKGFLVGNVKGHPAFCNGDQVKTGSIEKFDGELGIACTRRTMYVLGALNLDFDNWMKRNGYAVEDYTW